jgi:hypothetical protein
MVKWGSNTVLTPHVTAKQFEEYTMGIALTAVNTALTIADRMIKEK